MGLKLIVCNPAAVGPGFASDEIFNLFNSAKFDCWFLTQMKEIVDFGERPAATNE